MFYLTQFVVSFVSVFAKGLQQQNVIGGKYKSAFMGSFAVTFLEIAFITLAVKSDTWWSVLPLGFGSACGVVLSMYAYRNFHKILRKL